MADVIFSSRYRLNNKPVLVNCKPGNSRVQQHAKDECDVNKIMDRFCKTGLLRQVQGSPSFGDFSSGDDFHSLRNRIIAAEREFDALPVKIRHRFENSVANMLSFLADESNNAEAVELGLKPDSVLPKLKSDIVKEQEKLAETAKKGAGEAPSAQ